MFASILRSRQYRPLYDAPKVGTRIVRRTESPASSLSDDETYTLEPFTLLLPEHTDEETVKNRKKATKKVVDESIGNDGEIHHKHIRICTVCRENDCIIL